jgi:hypothetical protein
MKSADVKSVKPNVAYLRVSNLYDRRVISIHENFHPCDDAYLHQTTKPSSEFRDVPSERQYERPTDSLSHQHTKQYLWLQVSSN